MNPMIIQMLKNGGQGFMNGATEPITSKVDGFLGKAAQIGEMPESEVPLIAPMAQKFGVQGKSDGFSGQFGKMIGGQLLGAMLGQKPNIMNGLLGLGAGYLFDKMMEKK